LIVPDTNVIVGLAMNEPLSVAVHAKDSDWIAPAVWQCEMRNALLGLIRAGKINAQTAVELFQTAQWAVQSLESSTPSVLRVAEAYRLTAYDAEFAALAERMNVTLVSADSDLLTPGLAVHPKNF
jgi:predicted nucleic acid-binding protein